MGSSSLKSPQQFQQLNPVALQFQQQLFQQQSFQPNQLQRMPSQNASQSCAGCSAPKYVLQSSPCQQSPRKVVQPIVSAAPVQTIPPGGVPAGLFGTVNESANIMLEDLMK